MSGQYNDSRYRNNRRSHRGNRGGYDGRYDGYNGYNRYDGYDHGYQYYQQNQQYTNENYDRSHAYKRDDRVRGEVGVAEPIGHGEHMEPVEPVEPVLKVESGGVKKKSLMKFKKKTSGKNVVKVSPSRVFDDLDEKVEPIRVDVDEKDDVDIDLDDFIQTLETKNQNKRKFALSDESDTEIDPDNSVNDELLKLINKKEKEIPKHEIQTYPIQKEFYIESEFISSLSTKEVKQLRENDMIQIRGKNQHKPILEWNQLGLPSTIYDVLESMKFSSPTPIQCEALPHITSGSDFIGIAETGSGKTIAFLLPMFRHILSNRIPHDTKFQGSTPRAVILTPTRELAIQIAKAAKPFADNIGVEIVKCYGGQSISVQIAELKRKADIIIGTPGRIIDLLCTNNGKILNLSYVSYFVMDEADRMLDLGFEPQIVKILNSLRVDRQNVFFSATFPPKMQSIARKYTKNHVEVVVGSKNAVNENIEQSFEVLPDEEAKFSKLLQVLGAEYDLNKGKIIIFVERQNSCDRIVKNLLKRGYPVIALHGGKDQNEREGTIKDFKSGIIDIIVATSIASRGLDVDNLNLVINYDSPSHIEDYVHRVGRTGRAGNKGAAITFITPEQDRLAFYLVKILKTAENEIPEKLMELSLAYEEKVKSGDVKIGSGFCGKGGLEKLQLIRETNVSLERRVYLEEEDASIADKTALTTEQTPKVASLIPVEYLPYNEFEKNFAAKLFINDFAPKVRTEITSREQYSRVVELTNTAVTTRGRFYPLNMKRKQTEEDKLHILVEAPTEREVKEAILLFEESARRGLEREALQQ